MTRHHRHHEVLNNPRQPDVGLVPSATCTLRALARKCETHLLFDSNTLGFSKPMTFARRPPEPASSGSNARHRGQDAPDRAILQVGQTLVADGKRMVAGSEYYSKLLCLG